MCDEFKREVEKKNAEYYKANKEWTKSIESSVKERVQELYDEHRWKPQPSTNYPRYLRCFVESILATRGFTGSNRKAFMAQLLEKEQELINMFINKDIHEKIYFSPAADVAEALLPKKADMDPEVWDMAIIYFKAKARMSLEDAIKVQLGRDKFDTKTWFGSRLYDSAE